MNVQYTISKRADRVVASVALVSILAHDSDFLRFSAPMEALCCLSITTKKHEHAGRLVLENDPGPRSEPDSGNPAVRDRRGACGNVNDS